MMLRTIVFATVVVVMRPYFVDAQQKNGYSGGGPISPPAGNVVIHPSVEGPMGTLDQQIRWSDTIVDGYVTAVLPPINVNPAAAGNVETASLVTVNSVLRGKAPEGAQLLLIEVGGTQGQWKVIDPDNPLPQPGERYILFLHAYTASIPDSAGVLPGSGVVPRYRVVGYANGKARVDANGNIRFGPGAKYDMPQYNSVPSSSFISTLTARIAHLFPPPLPYPVGVTPIPLPGRITPLPAKTN